MPTDPVLHETLTAIMWLAHALRATKDGRAQMADMFLELARQSVMNAAQMAGEPPLPHPPDGRGQGQA